MAAYAVFSTTLGGIPRELLEGPASVGLRWAPVVSAATTATATVGYVGVWDARPAVARRWIPCGPAAPGCFIGLDPNSPLVPANFELRPQTRGLRAMLLDCQLWQIPVAWKLPVIARGDEPGRVLRSPRDEAFCQAAARVLIMLAERDGLLDCLLRSRPWIQWAAGGSPTSPRGGLPGVLFGGSPQLLALCDAATAIAADLPGLLGVPGPDPSTPAADSGTPENPENDLIGFACAAIAINYRLPAFVTRTLQLLDERTALQVAAIASGYRDFLAEISADSVATN